MSIKSRVRAIGVAVAASALALAGGVAATPAYAASGTVTCATSAVVGMWVNVSGGTSGWASLTPTSNPNIKNWSYDTQGKTWNANVGCGGTPQNWAQSIHLDWTTRTSGTIVCADAGYIRTCVIN